MEPRLQVYGSNEDRYVYIKRFTRHWELVVYPSPYVDTEKNTKPHPWTILRFGMKPNFRRTPT